MVDPSRVYDLLLELEWRYNAPGDYFFCPSCGEEKEDGHGPDCELAGVMEDLAEEFL